MRVAVIPYTRGTCSTLVKAMRVADIPLYNACG